MRYIAAVLLLTMVLGAIAYSETIRTTRKNNYIREGPGSYYDLVTVVPENTALEVLEKSGQWVKVKLPGQKSGWVAANSLTSKKGSSAPSTSIETVMASPKASRAGISAAIKGFGEKYSGTSEKNVDAVVTLGQKAFSPDELRVFLDELRAQPSANRGKASWESLGLQNVRTDPRLSDQSVGLSIASRLAARGLVQNPGLHRYVNLVAAALVATSPLYDWDINVYLLDEMKPVTYAVPGGFIFLSTGALRRCSNEAELAALMGHEIGAFLTLVTLQEPTERTTLNAIDDAFRELDEEVEKLEEERAGVEELVDNTYKKVVAPRPLKLLMDADRIGSVLCAAANYDPFVAVEMSGVVESEEESEINPADAKRRQDALKKFCVRRFATKNAGMLMSDRFTAAMALQYEK